jgi:riboflavin synthase
MFTGIVREIGAVHSVRRGRGVTVLAIDAASTAPGLAVGDSVSVNGVCLTVTTRRGPRFTVDLSPETTRRTTAGRWRAGDRVHLEPSLRASDALGGHFVLGHVDDVGRVARVTPLDAARQVTVMAPAAVLRLLLPKGSVAVDGVSLTLDEGPFDRSFTVTLIPQTLRETRLAALRPGASVNLEADVLAKAGRRAAGDLWLAAGGSITRDTAAGRKPHAAGRTMLTVQDIRKYGW